MTYDLIVIGGGAAGFYGAIQAAEMKAGLQILILEKTSKLLSKVKVSGGGRCNVTHENFNAFELARHYPRGEKFLKNVFKEYHARHVVNWFQDKGVVLKTETDGRMFPVTDDSQTIINCLLRESTRHGIRIEQSQVITHITAEDNGILTIHSSENQWMARKCLIATGGQNNRQAYQWIASLGHQIKNPLPSLFTFNDRDKRFTDLMGISVSEAEVRIQGTKFLEVGPVLVTHWGLSGPAVIKLSAWAAEYLYEKNYTFDVSVNWLGNEKENVCRTFVMSQRENRGRQKVHTNPLYGLPSRLWQRFCELSEIEPEKIWNEVPNKQINRLVEQLVHSVFHIQGKTTFKEEFVICGGIELSDIDAHTMESKRVPNVYFAGEVLNIDGETGGFNFQNAWSTAHCAARGITASKN